MTCEELKEKVKDCYQNRNTHFEVSFRKKVHLGLRWKVNSIQQMLYYKLYENILNADSLGERQLHCAFLKHSWMGKASVVNLWKVKWLPRDGDAALKSIADVIENIPSNEYWTLDFSFMNVSSNWLIPLCTAIAKKPLPEWISFEFDQNPKIGSKGIEHVAKMIKKSWLSKRANFSFLNCDIDSMWMKFLSDAIVQRGLKDWVMFDFTLNNFKTEWFLPICHMIEQVDLKKKSEFKFMFCWIDDMGIAAFAASIPSMKFDESVTFRLNWNPFWDLGAQHLLDVIRAWHWKPWLKLYVSGTLISVEMKVQLHRELVVKGFDPDQSIKFNDLD